MLIFISKCFSWCFQNLNCTITLTMPVNIVLSWLWYTLSYLIRGFILLYNLIANAWFKSTARFSENDFMGERTKILIIDIKSSVLMVRQNWMPFAFFFILFIVFNHLFIYIFLKKKCSLIVYNIFENLTSL